MGDFVDSITTYLPHLPSVSSDIFCPQGSWSSSSLYIPQDRGQTRQASKEKASQIQADGCARNTVGNKTFISFSIPLNLKPSPQSLTRPPSIRHGKGITNGVRKCLQKHLSGYIQSHCDHSTLVEPLGRQWPTTLSSRSSTLTGPGRWPPFSSLSSLMGPVYTSVERGGALTKGRLYECHIQQLVYATTPQWPSVSPQQNKRDEFGDEALQWEFSPQIAKGPFPHKGLCRQSESTWAEQCPHTSVWTLLSCRCRFLFGKDSNIYTQAYGLLD